jgi:hypothetical protein
MLDRRGKNGILMFEAVAQNKLGEHHLGCQLGTLFCAKLGIVKQ